MRDSAETMARHGANIQAAASGLPVDTFPDFSEVRLRDGLVIKPRAVLTTTETGQGLVSVVDQAIVDSLLPQKVDVTAGM